MWESDLSKITLLDVIDACDISVRTSNCIRSAIKENLLSVNRIKTVKKYIDAGDMAMIILRRLPNMGRKSVFELDDAVHNIVEEGGMNIPSAEDINEEATIDSGVACLKISDVVDTNIASERLRNSINNAQNNGSMPIETLGEYVKAGRSALQIMRQIPSFGKKTAYELDGLIKERLEFDKNNACVYEGHEIPNNIASLKIGEIINSNITSERLRNSICQVDKKGMLPITTIREYVKAGSKAIRIMQQVPSMGRKTAIELDELIIRTITEPDYNTCNDDSNVKEIGVESSGFKIDAADAQERLLEKLRDLLSEREYGVLNHRAMEGKTLEESGEIYDVTRERIRQVEKKAKLKLLKVYRDVFNQVVNNIDRILDDSYGEVCLLDAAAALNMTEDILKLLVYICADQCKKPVRIRRGYLYRTSTESNHSYWNEAIDEVLYSLEWPISVGWIYYGLQDIPHSYIDRYLEKNRGAKIVDGIIIELKKIPRSARMLYVLRDAGHALHSSEIARRYGAMFGQNIQEHNAQAVVARMDEALIVDRGVYSLYELLDVSEEIIEDVRCSAYDYIKNKEKYVSSKVIYEELFNNNVDFQGIDNAYIVHGILQDDDRFVIRRGLMVGIKGHSSFKEFKPLTDEVHEIVENNGPLSVAEILKAISEHRKILNVSVSKILEDSNRIIRVTPGRYDTITNVFGKTHLFDNLILAIKIALSDHDQGLFELTLNIRSLEIISDIEINKSILSSVLNFMDDVTRKGQTYSIDHIDEDMRLYNTFVHSDEKKSKLDLQKEAEKQLGPDLAKKYISVDYRLHSFSDKSSIDKSQLESSSEISSILSAFGV